MSGEAENSCPLCLEEMDLTDKQLKPCKCGYEICVWCWHHIMEMAEKEDTEGRCPACRTPYNKEKIVGTTASCGRLVSEMSMERKVKSQKGKSKPSEGRKQLSSVRVIQRNLVYIVGLPLNLADEDLLQRKEYFAQYGKVLKVSISRTTTGAIQQFANSTCSVYITYSKEEEAVRCIQSVHGFVLDSRPLRACFGTTKYCHSWLRNVPCTNPDCLYLHEVGLHEESFTKDEIISGQTRSRVQQITGATNNMQWRTGNILPPPADEYSINSSGSPGKSVAKSAPNNPPSNSRGSPPSSSPCQTAALPAAASWASRASNSQSTSGSLVYSNGPSKRKPETCTGSVAFSTAVTGTAQVPVLHDVGKKLTPGEEGRTILHRRKQETQASVRQYVGADCQSAVSKAPASVGVPAKPIVNGHLHTLPVSEDRGRSVTSPPTNKNSSDHSHRPGLEKGPSGTAVSKNIRDLCSDMTSMNIDTCVGGEDSQGKRNNKSSFDNAMPNSPEKPASSRCFSEELREPSTSNEPGKPISAEQFVRTTNSFTREGSVSKADSPTEVAKADSQVALPEGDENLLFFEDQRLKDPEVVTRTDHIPVSPHSFSNQSMLYSLQQNELHNSSSFDFDQHILNKEGEKAQLLHPSIHRNTDHDIRNHFESDRTAIQSNFSNGLHMKHPGQLGGSTVNADHSASRDMGENSIISDILSMDFDPWGESLSSPHNFAKLLGETDSPQGSNKLANSWKAQNSSQSRFSFARQEDSKNKVPGMDTSLWNVGQGSKDFPLSLNHGFPERGGLNFDNLGSRSNGFSSFNMEDYTSANNHSQIAPNNLSASRAQISAPPGFGLPNRAPPPGFAAQERMGTNFDSISGSNLFDVSSLMRNSYQAQPTGNYGSSGDLEFMDPAILAVGKGRLPVGVNNASGLDMRLNFPTQYNAFESEAGLHASIQSSMLPLQNQRYADMSDGGFPFSDAYRTSPRVMDQTLANNLSPYAQLPLQQSRNVLMPNGQWDSWNDVQRGNDLGMTDLLRSEILGYNKLYTGYEDSKFRMPNSGDMYNRTYGI